MRQSQIDAAGNTAPDAPLTTFKWIGLEVLFRELRQVKQKRDIHVKACDYGLHTIAQQKRRLLDDLRKLGRLLNCRHVQASACERKSRSRSPNCRQLANVALCAKITQIPEGLFTLPQTLTRPLSQTP